PLLARSEPRKSATGGLTPAIPQSATRVSILYYCLALLCFVCGLLSKPMVVTLPFICLLLDFWPLQRFKATMLSRLILEKLPFFALSGMECVVTYLVQKHGGAVVVNDPLSFRVSNALWAYERYIAKTFWPTHLSIVYPYVHGGLAVLAIGSALLLAVCSIAFIGLSRRWPYLFTGWFWFLGALVPVIGFVEIGPASMADRYTYLPDIGLAILATWALADLLRRQKIIAVAIGILALAACVVLTSIQIRYWRDSITLFRHAIAVTKANAVACACLGQALEVAGQEGEALAYCQKAVRIDPLYPAGQFFLGQVLWKLGNPSEALSHLQTAARSAPDNPGFQYNLGKFLLERGQTNEAIGRFKAALNDEPGFPEAHNALGKAFLKQGAFPKALDQLSQAVRLEPGNAQFHYDLGTVLLARSSPARAIAQFTQAIRLKPDFASAQENLAVALAGQGDMDGALDHFARAVELQPKDPEAHFNFGFARLNNHQPAEAAKQFQEELRLTPNEPKAHYRLAQALRAQNELPRALSEYRKTLKLAPDFAAARHEMDEILAAHPQLR
ncbi:MAG: tetratricopeptide repeat protein, partial [Limisphaerales bacterium]